MKSHCSLKTVTKDQEFITVRFTAARIRYCHDGIGFGGGVLECATDLG